MHKEPRLIAPGLILDLDKELSGESLLYGTRQRFSPVQAPPNKYKPHQGRREIERRLKRLNKEDNR